MPDIIGDRYEIQGEMNVVANGNWCFAKDLQTGQIVFLKEFNHYRYTEVSDEEFAKYPQLVQANERTDAYRQHAERINQELAPIARNTGDLVVALAFFRHDKFLYKVNLKFDFIPWQAFRARFADAPDGDLANTVDRVVRRLAYALNRLHSVNIVHNDLKPDNIFIVEEENGSYVGKIADFDDSFFMDDVPPADETVGTPAYYSPELYKYIISEGDEQPEELPIRGTSDIFALGVIYHQYLTGDVPGYDQDAFDSCAHALLSGRALQVSEALDCAHRTIIEKMIAHYPKDRYQSCAEIALDIGNIAQRKDRVDTVIVTRNGAPERGKTVELCVMVGDKVRPVGKAITDERGRATFKGLLPCAYIVRCGDRSVALDGRSSDARPCEIRFGEAPPPRTTTQPPRTTTQPPRPVSAPPPPTTKVVHARIKVVDAENAPVPGATVAICVNNGGSFTTVRSQMTEANGIADMGEYPPGTYSAILSWLPPGYTGSLNAHNNLPFNKPIKNILLTAKRVGVLLDQTFDPPIGGKFRRLVKLENGRCEITLVNGRVISARTDELGLYKLDQIG